LKRIELKYGVKGEMKQPHHKKKKKTKNHGKIPYELKVSEWLARKRGGTAVQTASVRVASAAGETGRSSRACAGKVGRG